MMIYNLNIQFAISLAILFNKTVLEANTAFNATMRDIYTKQIWEFYPDVL